MAKYIYSFIILMVLSSFSGDREIYSSITHDSFDKGEILEYKLKFGFITVGNAEFVIDNDIRTMNDRECHKIDIYARTSSWINWISKVEDQWGAYVDTEAILPHMTYRNIREGRYRKNEEIYFDHFNNQVEAKVINKKTGEFKPSVYYDVPNNVRDMISGLAYMRTVDYSNYKNGDRIKIDAFFEDEVYDFYMVFKKREVIKTKLGKINAIKLMPEMPDNEIFDGKNSISVWISDDENHIPLKFEAKMFLGNAGVEINGHKGLSHPLNFAQK